MLLFKRFFLLMTFIFFASIKAEFEAYIDILPLNKSFDNNLQIFLVKETKMGWFGRSYEEYINPRAKVIINAQVETQEAQDEALSKATEFFNEFLKKQKVDVIASPLIKVIGGEMFGPFSEFGKRKNHFVYLAQIPIPKVDVLSSAKLVSVEKILNRTLTVAVDPTLVQLLETNDFKTALEESGFIAKTGKLLSQALSNLAAIIQNLKDTLLLSR
ncbi:hypothetical protein HYX58_02285 [Candidatus Dependentiae bacterium]|nr:hypothetical protein [Candidatus Dependentiae bacterium]